MLKFRVAELMKEKGVTYREVSKGAKVSTSSLYKIVKGKQKMIGVDVLERLLLFFDCSPCDLLVLENEAHQ